MAKQGKNREKIWQNGRKIYSFFAVFLSKNEVFLQKKRGILSAKTVVLGRFEAVFGLNLADFRGLKWVFGVLLEPKIGKISLFWRRYLNHLAEISLSGDGDISVTSSRYLHLVHRDISTGSSEYLDNVVEISQTGSNFNEKSTKKGGDYF